MSQQVLYRNDHKVRNYFSKIGIMRLTWHIFWTPWILKTSFLLVLKKGGFTLRGQTLFWTKAWLRYASSLFLRNKTRNLLGSMDKPSCKKNKASRVVCNNVLSLSRVSYRYTRVRAVLDNARKFSSLGKLFWPYFDRKGCQVATVIRELRAARE